MTHSVTHGPTIASKYAGLGNAVSTGRSVPSRMLGLVVGEAGCGKSFLLQSHPGAYILNLDETPAVCSTSEAVMFPTPGPDGRSIDERGNPVVIDWAALEAKHKVLLDLAKSNQPRPETVVIDTLGAAIRLLRPHIAKLYGRERFTDVDGRLGWERLFDTLIEFGTSLRRHGYGVYYIAHLSRKHVPLSENQHVEEYKILISDGLYARMFPMFDIVIPVTAQWDTREVVTEQTVEINGKPVSRKVTSQQKIRRHYASFDNPKLDGIAKVRTLTPLSTFELPRENAWQSFCAAYESANAVR
jgi:hypothetical protein